MAAKLCLAVNQPSSSNGTCAMGARKPGLCVIWHPAEYNDPYVGILRKCVFSMDRLETLRAYRHLFRAALRAVRHSSPAKYQIRDTMRSAFRTGAVDSLDNQRVQNTLHFLRRAELYAGLEHKILQNLLHVNYWRNQGRRDNRLSVMSSRCVI